MIKPTPGRIVWYYPDHKENLEVLMDAKGKRSTDPLAAIVLAVYSDTRVNLLVISAYGQTRFLSRVELWQGEGERPKGHGYAAWMPYQLGQARKEEDRATSCVAGGLVGSEGAIGPVGPTCAIGGVTQGQDLSPNESP